MTFEQYLIAEIAQCELYAKESEPRVPVQHLAKYWALSRILEKFKEVHRDELHAFRDWLSEQLNASASTGDESIGRTGYLAAMNLIDQYRSVTRKISTETSSAIELPTCCD